MSLLDKNIEEKTEDVCYERYRLQIEEFMSNHMSTKPIDQMNMPWHSLTSASTDASSFTYGYFPSPPSHYIRGIGGGRSCTSPRISENYVQCSYPILDEISLRLVRDNDYHLYPFVIHYYDGEYLPDFIKFMIRNGYVRMNEDEIYVNRINKIQIYLDNCPNLKPRNDESDYIVFIRLS